MLKENAFLLKKYRKLFVAAILGWVVSLLGGMADSVIAGIFLDSEAVSAVELLTPIASVVYFISLVIGVGCSILYSTELGAFRKEKSEKVAGMGLFVCVVIGVILFVLVATFKEQILGFYGCTGTVYDYASKYYIPCTLYAAISPLLWLIYYLVSYDGDSGIVLASDVIMTVGNAVLSFVFVRSLGILGLSLGTVLSEIAGLLVLLPHFFKKSNSIRFRFYFNFKDLFKMMKYSSASSLTVFYIGVVDIIFNKFIITRYGENFIPAYTVVNAVLDIAAVFLCAINSGMVFISVAYGENNIFAIRRTMKIVDRDTILTGLLFSVLLFLAAPYWPKVFAITDPVVEKAAVFAGRVIPLTYVAAALVYEYLSYYPMINKPFEGNMLGINYMLIGPVVLALPAGLIWGFNGMIVGFALTPVFAILVELLYFAIKKQLKKAPILLQNNNGREWHFDLILNEQNIVELRNKVEESLKETDIPSKIIIKVLVVLEDTLVYIKKKNEKKVFCECTVLVNDTHIRLITKDNGIIFDMVKEADDSLDLSCYVVARMMESASEKTSTTTISFNRNTYLWDLVQEQESDN